MPVTNNQPTRIAAICEPGPTQQQITTALSNQPEFQLVDILTTLDKLSREIRAAEPDILLVDYQIGGQPTLDIIDDIAMQFPELAIVAILPGEDPLKAQQSMLAGARAFIVQPFTQVNLLSTLRRVRDLEARRQQARPVQMGGKQDESKPVRTIAVYSPRGGAGCSTLAANLAIALHEETDARVLLLEGKLSFGHLGVMLNLRTRNTIADLLPHAAGLDNNLIKEVVSEHISGIHVLLAPPDIQVAQGTRAEDLYNVLTALQRQYDYVVIDVGSYLNENSVTLMDAADRVLLVASPDLAGLQDTSRFVQISRTLAFPAGKLLVVLNRAEVLGGVRTADIESVLHHELYATIPEDGPSALRSLNRGIPMLLKYSRSPASKAIERLAKSLLASGSPAPAAQKSGKPAEVKLRAAAVTEKGRLSLPALFQPRRKKSEKPESNPQDMTIIDPEPVDGQE